PESGAPLNAKVAHDQGSRVRGLAGGVQGEELAGERGVLIAETLHPGRRADSILDVAAGVAAVGGARGDAVAGGRTEDIVAEGHPCVSVKDGASPPVWECQGEVRVQRSVLVKRTSIKGESRHSAGVGTGVAALDRFETGLDLGTAGVEEGK